MLLNRPNHRFLFHYERLIFWIINQFIRCESNWPPSFTVSSNFRSCVFGCRCWSWPDSGLKWTFLLPKGNCKELISICLLEAGRPSFRPELINSSDQKLDFELDLKLEMTETQQMEMKAEGQMENHLIC